MLCNLSTAAVHGLAQHLLDIFQTGVAHFSSSSKNIWLFLAVRLLRNPTCSLICYCNIFPHISNLLLCKASGSRRSSKVFYYLDYYISPLSRTITAEWRDFFLAREVFAPVFVPKKSLTKSGWENKLDQQEPLGHVLERISTTSSNV